MSVWAVIVAAGSGTRMGLSINKTLAALGGETVLERSVRAFDGLTDGVVVVYRAEDEETVRALDLPVTLAPGGDTRQASVLNGLRALPEDAEIHCFYYVLNRRENEKVPPRFNYNLPSCHYVYFEGNKENVIGFLNQGGKSKGVGVWLSGPCIWKHEFRATKTMLQMRGAHDEWQFVPIEMKEATTADGVSGLYGECADLRIPPAVPEGLPWKRKMDMEARRAICFRFSLEKDQAKEDAEEYGDLQVTMIPLQNVSGQSSWMMTCYPKKTWQEWLRRPPI